MGSPELGWGSSNKVLALLVLGFLGFWIKNWDYLDRKWVVSSVMYRYPLCNFSSTLAAESYRWKKVYKLIF